jgi:hypothetical protein
MDLISASFAHSKAVPFAADTLLIFESEILIPLQRTGRVHLDAKGIDVDAAVISFAPGILSSITIE